MKLNEIRVSHLVCLIAFTFLCYKSDTGEVVQILFTVLLYAIAESIFIYSKKRELNKADKKDLIC